jgi:hypothetical protein
MGQEPNIEVTPDDLPRGSPQPQAARRWRPARPGVITSPDQMRWGGAFGTPGPDTGYALVLIRRAQLPDHSPSMEGLLITLMGARSSLFGRAPIQEDLEVALMILGIGDGLPEWVTERGRRWLQAAGREKVPGRSVLAELDQEVLRAKPGQIKYLLNR